MHAQLYFPNILFPQNKTFYSFAVLQTLAIETDKEISLLPRRKSPLFLDFDRSNAQT